jgi:sn-glycerol 3-phosphate transport system substrate-binding protein
MTIRHGAKWFTPLVVAAAVAFGAAGDAAAQSRIKFEFWQGLSGDLGERVNDVCKRFNDSQTEFEIVCTTQGSYDAAVQNSIAAYRAKKHPTIVQVYDAGTLDLMLSDAFVPAKNLMEENGYKINWSNYFPGIANYYATSKGDLLSFPFNSSTALFYWNKDGFAKVGLSAAPKTWEEVETIAKKMKAAGMECPLAIDYDTWQWMEQFHAIHNQPIASRDNGYAGLDAELTINKSKYVDFVKWMKRGYDEGWARLKTRQTGATIGEAFAAGDCQMSQFSVASHGTITRIQKPGLNWDVAMMPVFEGTQRRNSLVGGASLWVLQGKSKDEYRGAAAFLNFIAKPDSEEYFSTITGYIPVTKTGFEAMKAKGFYDKAPFKGRELAIQSLTASEVGPLTRGIRLGGFIQIRKEVSDSLEAIFANKVSVEQGLNQAVERSNGVLRRFERTYAGKQLL